MDNLVGVNVDDREGIVDGVWAGIRPANQGAVV